MSYGTGAWGTQGYGSPSEEILTPPTTTQAQREEILRRPTRRSLRTLRMATNPASGSIISALIAGQEAQLDYLSSPRRERS